MAQREWLEKDYYAVLGVAQDAPADEIKKAYKKLARTYHPDANPDDAEAEKKFKEVGEAYGVLGNEESRAEYDQIRRLGASGFTGGFGGGNAGGFGDFEDLLSAVFGGSGGGFSSGGGFGPRAARPIKGRDLAADVHLSFDDALAGVKTTLRVRGPGPCETCRGTGAAPGTSPVTCEECGGRGQVAVDQGPFSFAQPCPTCGGRGQTIPNPCSTCRGTGSTIRERDLSLRIPAGIRDGAVIRAPRRGGPGQNGGPPGDVLVTVHVDPHTLFGRRGDHVTLEVPLTFAEAALGTKLAVPVPSGGTSTIRIPAGTTSGRTFRVRGKGVNGKGDLLVTVVVDVPTKLTREQKKLLEQLGELDDTSVRDRRLLGAAGNDSNLAGEKAV